MRGRRNARSRVRGSWAARLTGTAFAILLAGAGVAAYLIVGAGHASKDASVLPTRVLGTQAISLVSPGGPAASGASQAPLALLTSRSGLGFTAAAPAGADWTADQMAGGTYIFIYLPDGLCLGSARGAAVALQRCNLEAGQRWVRQHAVIGVSGLDYWQLRNLATGRCLTAAGPSGASGGTPARLERCPAAPGSAQLIGFLTVS